VRNLYWTPVEVVRTDLKNFALNARIRKSSEPCDWLAIFNFRQWRTDHCWRRRATTTQFHVGDSHERHRPICVTIVRRENAIFAQFRKRESFGWAVYPSALADFEISISILGSYTCTPPILASTVLSMWVSCTCEVIQNTGFHFNLNNGLCVTAESNPLDNNTLGPQISPENMLGSFDSDCFENRLCIPTLGPHFRPPDSFIWLGEIPSPKWQRAGPALWIAFPKRMSYLLRNDWLACPVWAAPNGLKEAHIYDYMWSAWHTLPSANSKSPRFHRPQITGTCAIRHSFSTRWFSTFESHLVCPIEI